MKLKISPDPNNPDEFWIYNPIGGHGRWCHIHDGIVMDSQNSMFAKRSPETYQRALKSFLKKI